MSSNSSPSARLLAYGALASGVTALMPGNAEAATVIPVNSASFDTGGAAFGIITATSYVLPPGEGRNKGYLISYGLGLSFTTGDTFRRGTDATTVDLSSGAAAERMFFNGEEAREGALLGSSDNWFYAISFDDPTQRMWLQLHFGESGIADFSIVKAVVPDFVGELPSARDAANVPETSSLALLSLGAAGLLKRRRRAA